MSIFIEVSGWIAAILCILMYFPQTIKTIKTKKTDELSKTTFVLVAFGTTFWSLYSACVNAYQGWFSNFIIFFLMLPILFYIFNQKIFFSLTIVLSIIIFTSILIWILNINLNVSLIYFIVILSSICTGVPFYFQAYKTLKNKLTSELSLLSSILIFTSCSLWSIYWCGLFLTEFNGTYLIALISSLAATAIQIPLMVLITKY